MESDVYCITAVCSVWYLCNNTVYSAYFFFIVDPTVPRYIVFQRYVMDGTGWDECGTYSGKYLSLLQAKDERKKIGFHNANGG